MLSAALLAFVLGGSTLRADEVSLTEELLALGEATDPARLVELARFGTPQALAGLLALRDELQSVYMQREVLRAMALLLEPDATRAEAVLVLRDAAQGGFDPHLRLAAVDALAEVAEGRQALAAIALDDEQREDIRLEALRGFTRQASAEDAPLLERLSAPGPGRSAELRATAFRAAIPWMSNDTLQRATRHELSAVRVAALEAMLARGDKRADDTAQRMYAERHAPSEERLIAFRAWLAGRHGKEARRALEEALGSGMPETLALGMAEALGALADPALVRSVVRLLKGVDEHELRILLRAARTLDDPEVAEAFVAALSSEDPRLVREAADGIAVRRQRDASAALEKLFEGDAEGWLGSVAVSALAAIHPEEEWTTRLVALTRDPRSPVRCAALRGLCGRAGPAVEQALAAALEHEDWSTRLAALQELERRASPEVVGTLCRRSTLERGRMLHELTDALRRLTGEAFGPNGRAWAGWWKQHGATFRILTPAELARRAAEREERVLRRTTSVAFLGGDGESRFLRDLPLEDQAFFGLLVVSRQVAFVIDVSTSMDERLDAPLDEGRIRTRLDFALHEVARILGLLERETRFRVITMAGSVGTWSEELRTATPEGVASAREYVLGLGSSPGTNVYDALRLAFADPSIDTIYLLSDGEPTFGDVQDPGALQGIVREWNQNRGIVLHCIAIGPDLGLLRGLARDSGGAYLHFR